MTQNLPSANGWIALAPAIALLLASVAVLARAKTMQWHSRAVILAFPLVVGALVLAEDTSPRVATVATYHPLAVGLMTNALAVLAALYAVSKVVDDRLNRQWRPIGSAATREFLLLFADLHQRITGYVKSDLATVDLVYEPGQVVPRVTLGPDPSLEEKIRGLSQTMRESMLGRFDLQQGRWEDDIKRGVELVNDAIGRWAVILSSTEENRYVLKSVHAAMDALRKYAFTVQYFLGTPEALVAPPGVVVVPYETFLSSVRRVIEAYVRLGGEDSPFKDEWLARLPVIAT